MIPFNRTSYRKLFYGTLAAGHVLFTMIFPYFSTPIAVWLIRHKLVDVFIAAFAVPFFGTAFYFAYRRWRYIQLKRKISLLAAGCLYWAAYIPLEYHLERLHILNFSFMGIVMYKSFSPWMKLWRAALLSLIVTITIGTIDEYIQRWIVGRSSTLHDVLLCVEGAFLGVALAWIFDAYSRKGRPDIL